MLKLRKILLLDIIYYLIFICILFITIVRITIPKKSIYNINTNSVEGIIINKVEKDNKITLIIKSKEKIQVNYYLKNNKKINLNLGDKVIIYGKIKEIEEQKTKCLFDYKKYLSRKNIHYIFSASNIKIIKPNKNIFLKIKQKLINSFNNNPYINTFIIGDKSYIEDEVKRAYQENGISHLFAISGMHITLLSTIIEKLLLKLKIKEVERFKIISIILLIYLLLVGLSPSILRGVLFYIIFKINNIFYFYIKPVNLFLFIISISLLINPNYIFDIGFQYSYLISLSLINLSKDLKSKNYFISLLKVSLISFIVSIPITIYNFYQLNILSIFYNLIFVPLVSLIIFPMTLIIIFIKPLEPIYNLLIKVLEFFSLNFSKINLGKLIFIRLHVIIYLVYFFIVLIYIFRNKKEYLYLLLILLFIHYLSPLFLNTTYVNYIDVGQGDSVLIHKNKTNILIDTGGSLTTHGTITNNTLLPILKSSGINKLDAIIITHGDADHMGEAMDLINKFKVKKVIFNCGEFNNLEKKFIKLLDSKKIKYYICINELNLKDIKILFLNNNDYGNENDNSNVLYTELNNHKFLFMGDAGIDVELDLIEKYNLKDIDVLKIGHHGSKTSSSKKFINEINNKYSIISVGRNNKYNHPNKEVLNNLKETKIYRTDEEGSIVLKIKNNKMKIETYIQ